MKQFLYKIYLSTLVLIVVGVLLFLLIDGYSYYQLSLEERFYHDQHQALKPSGVWGHGLGIVGSFLIVTGVSLYMVRKRVRLFSRLGILKYWLEFHIFLCTLGPILVLFHTAFKFGGIVAISFWSMVAVVFSGIIGRYIYLQIPRTIEGRELSLVELDQKKVVLNNQLKAKHQLDEQVINQILTAVKARPTREGGNMFQRFFIKFQFETKVQPQIKTQLKQQQLSREEFRKIWGLVRAEILLNRKIDRLINMQNLFRYWHVAHLPFALIMLVIMVIHVAVTLTFGYKWIF
ncbi:hypothetical protein [Sunxiuqinia sp. sy24]|uniref:hypothetical protein n=1 Tax=Sunxiuqinia sp. sy24 TaxID=3461495 RepID=UPI0040466721